MMLPIILLTNRIQSSIPVFHLKIQSFYSQFHLKPDFKNLFPTLSSYITCCLFPQQHHSQLKSAKDEHSYSNTQDWVWFFPHQNLPTPFVPIIHLRTTASELGRTRQGGQPLTNHTNISQNQFSVFSPFRALMLPSGILGRNGR
ncbi:UNVERIFIED_CONTAM: hypothetical protein K2H54_030403 [Gekko kuhli]